MSKKAWPILWGFLQIMVFLAPLVGLVILLDNTTPRHWFPFPVPLLIILWLVILVMFLRRIWRNWRVCRNRAAQDRPKRGPLGRQALVIFLIFVLVIVGIAFLVGHLVSQRTSAVNQDLLIESKQHFNVALVGNVPQECSDQTQIELERALQNLEKELEPVAPLPIIEVYVYPNAKEFHEKTGAPGNVAAYSECLSSGPMIVLPVVNCGDKSSNSATAWAASHEMVHAYVCVLVGSDKNEVMPRWFREGLAYFEGNKAWWNVLNRIKLRGWLWRYGDRIMDQNSLSNYVPNSSPDKEDEDNVFVLCSFEFMRYTVNASTADVPWTIISKVRDGESFEKAFEDTTGTPWEDLYAKWLSSF